MTSLAWDSIIESIILDSCLKTFLVAMRFDEATDATLLHVCAAALGKGHHCYDIKEGAVPIDEWFNLNIKQEQNDEDEFIYSISMDGAVLKSWKNDQPLTFENVNGFLANTIGYPERFDKVPVGRYRNFEFTTSEPVDCKIIEQDVVLHEGITVYPNYEVSIDLNLEELNPKTNHPWYIIYGFNQQGVDTLGTDGYRIPTGKF